MNYAVQGNSYLNEKDCDIIRYRATFPIKLKYLVENLREIKRQNNLILLIREFTLYCISNFTFLTDVCLFVAKPSLFEGTRERISLSSAQRSAPEIRSISHQRIAAADSPNSATNSR